MDLTLEQLRDITLGAVWIRQQEGGIVFSRFTDEQLALYDNTTIEYQANFRYTIRYNAGIKLSFRTDSRTLHVAGRFYKDRPMRKFFALDVEVNGQYIGSLDNFSHKPMPEDIRYEPYELGDFEKTFVLGEGEKTVCVQFPWSVCPVFQRIALEDGASLIPVRPPKKLLAYGDSITQGFDSMYPHNRPVHKLAQLLEAEEFCKACGGECFYAPLGALGDDFTPDYIYVAYGTNDWSKKTYKDFLENCRGFLTNLRKNYPTTPILLVTPIWRQLWRAEKEFGPFPLVEQTLRQMAEEFTGIHLIRGFEFVPQDPDMFSDKTLHPNDAGFAHYSENLLAAVRQLKL